MQGSKIRERDVSAEENYINLEEEQEKYARRQIFSWEPTTTQVDPVYENRYYNDKSWK